MTKPAELLWIDLEMTGLDPQQDRILEVAAIATDWDFRTLAQFSAVVKVDQALIDRRMIGPFWQKFAAVKKQLVAQNENGQSAAQVERQLLEFVGQNFEAEPKIILAGNSIHQDRKFIDQQWPTLAQALHYRMLDVSAWKIVFEGRFAKKFAKPEAHRALDDIKGSIDELKYYLKELKNVES